MNETPDREYKDDPKDFAQSSDLAQRGKTGEYAGGGPDDSSANFTPARGEQAWQHASDDSQNGPRTEGLPRRRMDSGQGSVGASDGDGAATDDDHPKP